MRRLSPSLAALALITLAGCSASPAGAPTTAATTTSTTSTTTTATTTATTTMTVPASAAPSDEPSAEASPSEEPSAPEASPSSEKTFRVPGTNAAGDAEVVAKFGQVATFDGGMQVAVEAPKPIVPAKTSTSYQTFPAHLVQTITLVNGGTQPWDANQFYVNGRSGGKDAHRFFDRATLKGDPTAPLAPGQSVTFQLAWDVADATDLRSTIKLDRAHKPVTFAR